MLITDLNRTSWLDDREFASEVSRQTQEDGSSCGWMNLVLECDTQSDPVQLSVQTIAVDGLKHRLMGRLPYGRELILNGKQETIIFKPGTQTSLTLVEDAVTLTMREDDLAKLTDSLQPHAGKYPIPGLDSAVINVLRTEIKDRDGNVVKIVE